MAVFENKIKEFITAAQQYEGQDKLLQMMSNSIYIEYDHMKSIPFANDFMLHFCKREEDPVPPVVAQQIASKFYNIKNDIADNLEPLRMNCLEFCLLAMHDASILSENELNDMAFMANCYWSRGGFAQILEAALREDALQLKQYTEQNPEKMLITAGDIVLRFDRYGFGHAFICLENNLQDSTLTYLELAGPSPVRRQTKPYNDILWFKRPNGTPRTTYFYISIAPDNLKSILLNYIQRNKETLLNAYRAPDKNLETCLKSTQYATLLEKKPSLEKCTATLQSSLSCTFFPSHSESRSETSQNKPDHSAVKSNSPENNFETETATPTASRRFSCCTIL